MGDGVFVAMSMICVPVSVANKFVHSSTAADHGNHSFGKIGAFHLLLAAENQEGSFAATFGTVAGVGEFKSFSISCN